MYAVIFTAVYAAPILYYTLYYTILYTITHHTLYTLYTIHLILYYTMLHIDGSDRPPHGHHRHGHDLHRKVSALVY